MSSAQSSCLARAAPLLLAVVLHLRSGRSLQSGSSCYPCATALSGRRVVITAPAAYSPRLSVKLAEAGAEVIPCPTISTRVPRPDESKDLDAAVEDAVYAGRYDDIFFCSRRAVVSFFASLDRLLEVQRAAPAKAAKVSLWALGADAGAIHEGLQEQRCREFFEGIFTVRQPELPSTRGFVQSQGPEAATRRALVLAPTVEKPLQEPFVVPALVAGLEERCSEVVRVGAYITEAVTPAETALAALREGSVDTLCFTSILEAASLLRHWQPGVNPPLVAAFGPVTARGLEGLGLSPDLVGQDFSSFKGFVAALQSHYAALDKR